MLTDSKLRAAYQRSMAMTDNEVWQRVCDFARKACAQKIVIRTLGRGVANTITDVKENSIGRYSDQGISNSSRVGKVPILRIWHALKSGQDPFAQATLYFAPALLQSALDDLIEFDSAGSIRLIGNPNSTETRQTNLDAESNGAGWAGGEGPVHKAIKDFVFNDPDTALRTLGLGPFTRLSPEFTFATGDRVDVALKSRDGKPVLVEVKPHIEDADKAPFAQAAKYRTLWSILLGDAEQDVVCVVVSPVTCLTVAQEMKKKHGVEYVAVATPK